MLAAMSERDEVDLKRAQQFAWSLKLPEELLEEVTAADDEAKTEAEEAEEVTEEERAALRRQAFEDCELLAAAVDRVWGLSAASDQARLAAGLCESASALGLRSVAMQHFPLQ